MMQLDPRIVFRRPVMDLLADPQTRITDNLDHIVFERGDETAVFFLDDSVLHYYLGDEKKVEYSVGRMLVIFALRRSLVENYLQL